MMSSVALCGTVLGTPQQRSFPPMRLHKAAIAGGCVLTPLPPRTHCPGSPSRQGAPEYKKDLPLGFWKRPSPERYRVDGVWVKLIARIGGRRSGNCGCSILVSRFGRALSAVSLRQPLLLGNGGSGSRDGFHRLRFHRLLRPCCPRRRSSENACLFCDATFR